MSRIDEHFHHLLLKQSYFHLRFEVWGLFESGSLTIQRSKPVIKSHHYGYTIVAQLPVLLGTNEVSC